jgi:hypothetical protein
MLAHEDFALALKRGKEPADDRVEPSLFHREVGYTFDAVKIGEEKTVMIPYREDVPPDTTACI